MRKRPAKKGLASFFHRKLRSSRRSKLQPIVNDSLHSVSLEELIAPVGAKGAKKKAGSRLWMLFDQWGKSEAMELDKSAIIRQASIPARDLRILGPLFARSPRIIVRDKAMVVNLESIKAIITADEVLLLDPLSNEVLPFVDQLKRQISLISSSKFHRSGDLYELSRKFSTTANQCLHDNGEYEQALPFELQILEAALEYVCISLDSTVSDISLTAYPALDELTMNASNKNLDRIRSLKSSLTSLLSRVQKVRDEIEHLLDSNEDLSLFYLTRKQIQNQQSDALSGTVLAPSLGRLSSQVLSSSRSVNVCSDDGGVDDLEMLLEAYFMQLEGTRNKILTVREYIDDTEDYVNIRLGNQRNELIQLQLVLSIVSFAIAVDSMIVGVFGMNIPCSLFIIDNIFILFVIITTGACFLIFLLLLAYARWKKVIGP